VKCVTHIMRLKESQVTSEQQPAVSLAFADCFGVSSPVFRGGFGSPIGGALGSVVMHRVGVC